MSEERGYNGWTNYETWLLVLWIDNEEGCYNYWREQARELHNLPDLAQILKDEFEEAAEEKFGESGFWLDLVTAALSEVDWREVASHLMDE